MNIRDYWNPSSPSYPKTRFVNKDASPDDWNEEDEEWEFEDDEVLNECDEDGHVPEDEWGIFTKCGFCKINLVRMLINDKKVYVDPNELKKLRQWNEMVSGGAQ